MVHNNIAIKIALRLLNSDSLEDCKKLIENIGEAYHQNNEENFSPSVGHDKVVNELKVLLEIYESLLVASATCKKECKFSFQSVLGIINNALKCPLSKNLEENLMQGIRCLHKITEITDSERCMKDLVEFYIENLEYIEVNHSCDDYMSKNISFRLEILCNMYSYSCSDSSNNFIVKFRTLAKNFKMKSIEEYTRVILSNLVFYGSVDVFKKTLHSVLPHLIKCSGDYEIISRIWITASNMIEFQSEGNEDKLLRIFLTLCYLYDMAFKENVSFKKTALIKLIFGSEKFWKFIQIGLCNREMKKSALFLFKNTVLLLMKTEDCLVVNKDDSVYVWWDSNVKKVMGPLYQKIMVILEYLDEKQVHLINPMLNMVEEAVEKILKKLSNDKYIEFSWIFLIYEHLLNHESAQVVKWGLKSFLKLPLCMYIDNMTIERSIALLIPVLNNTHLYYNDGIGISENLREFFKNFSQNENCYFFFNTLMKSICNLTWSPEPLFFVTHALANISNCHCLGEKEIRMIKLFIGKAFKTHNKTIRSATQNELLKIVLALTNPFKVSFDCLISLLSGFHELGSLRRGSKAWEKVIDWMISWDFIDKAQTWVQCEWNKINDEFKEIDAKAMALTFMLYMDFYLNFKELEKCELQNCFPIKIFNNMLKKFENCEKRVYYSEKVLNQILIVIFTILEENMICSTEKTCPLSIRVLPVFTDILYYIKRELGKITYLEDFDTASLHLKAFQVMTAHGLRNDSFDDYSSFLDEILGEISLDSIINENSLKFLSPLSFYCYMNLIKNLLECGTKTPTRIIYFYLIKSVNECLEKEETKEDLTEKLTNFQTIWGTMNSKFLETKWQIVEILIIGFKMDKTSGQTPLPENSLLNLCEEGIHVGGYELLFPIMSVLTHVFQETEDLKDGQILHLIWKNIMERRKTDSFKGLVKGFVKMLFQSKLMSKKEYNDIHLKYVDLIFEDRSIGVVRAFMKHIQSLKTEMSGSNSVFCHILLKALVFGPVIRKDERLIVQVCDLIDSLNISEISDCDTSNEIRGRAVEMILSLDKTNLGHREFAWQVIGNLLAEEKNEKNIRYFGDSHVHRVKHRLMQALLLLEPMIDCQDSAKKVSNWLYYGLLSENNQPSVKYQQEWLLLRLLVRYPLLFDEFWARLNESAFAGIKAKGLCSLFVISYHLCKSVPPSATSLSINEAILAILPFSMDQQFEIRLYAQVILKKLYQLAIDKRLQCILAKFEITNASILKSIQRGYKGNSSKNCEKLEQDFYLNEFHPFEHYTLKTIFEDLPRLANVGSDEWISLRMFDRCGLSCDRATITLKNTTDSLEKVEYAKWYTESSAHSSIKTPEEDDNVISNYQKKIVPIKASDSEFYSLEPDSYHRSSGVMTKDGLVVVATLIDRIPNLGGLARTCEIFGVSEYILGSLKYAEDKQFVSLSVTAEKWLNIKEVKEQNLIEYVLDMKKNGYVVIGAEQALYSVSLNSVQFPKKSLLLLGNEKEGVPPNLLPLLDVCVEVPQLGIIRSLNVHVTGALFIWEYAKQNYFSIS